MSSKSAELSRTEISLGHEQLREQVFDAYRRWGYLDANLNPFGGPIGGGYSDLPGDGEGAEEARRIYCGTIGAEFMHMPQRDRREWIQDRMENPGPQQVDRRWLAERLLQADLFEQILQTRYLGTKRYSGEGATAQIPLLDTVLETGAELGATTTVFPADDAVREFLRAEEREHDFRELRADPDAGYDVTDEIEPTPLRMRLGPRGDLFWPPTAENRVYDALPSPADDDFDDAPNIQNAPVAARPRARELDEAISQTDERLDRWMEDQQRRLSAGLDLLIAQLKERREIEVARLDAWKTGERQRVLREQADEEERFHARLLAELQAFEEQLALRLTEQEERLARWFGEAERMTAQHFAVSPEDTAG